MKKKFSLSEVIIVIAVLAILVSMIIPNISDFKGKSIATAVNSNINILQLATDMYALDNGGKVPTPIQPTIGKPQLIDFDLLYPNYIKSLPNEKNMPKQNYWVDYTGRVWGATVDAPNDIFRSDENVEWSNQDNIIGYNLYEVKEKETKTTGALKFFSLKKHITVSNAFDKIQLETDGKEYLISSVDKYGLETAPVSFDYEGVPQGKPLIAVEGVFYYEISSEKTLYWDDFKAIEQKPPGTDIVYSFAVGDDPNNLNNFVDDFYSLPPAKNIRVKIHMIAHEGKYPSLYDLRIYYHYEDEIVLTSRRVAESPTMVVDEVKLEDEYIRNIYLTDSYQHGNSITPSYSYSYDQNNYYPVTSLSGVPSGSYVRIQRESENSNVEFKDPIVIASKSQPRIHYVGLDETGDTSFDSELNDNSWQTIQKIVLYASTSSGQITHWISADIEDYQPENTRILYRYATSNDGRFGPDVADFGQLADSRMLRISVYLQKKKNLMNETEDPYLISIKINHSQGVIDLDTVKPTGVIVVNKSNNQQNDIISTESIIDWSFEAFDPQGKEIVEVQWGGDKREQYTTPGIYTVTLKLRNALNYWSDTINYTFEVKPEKPVAVLNPDRNVFSSRKPIQWDTSNSYDPDGDGIKKVEWGGDATSNHQYSPGTHTITMRVQDNEGYWSDWISKTFTTVDSIFYNTDVEVLDGDMDTRMTMGSYSSMNILWDEDITNRVVYFTWQSSNMNHKPALVIKDQQGNNLNFINAITGEVVSSLSVGTSKTTSAFIIPENAYSITINIGSVEIHHFTYVYDISLGESADMPNPISNLQIQPSHTSIEFTWNNDPNISKVHIYRNGDYVGTSTTSTFKDSPLLSDTTYNYEFVSVHESGNVAKYQTQAQTTRPEVIFSGVTPEMIDDNLSTYKTLSTKNFVNITWDKDITNRVVYITWKNSTPNINPTLYVKDVNGNNLSFINGNTGQRVTGLNASTSLTTYAIIIPENAHSIYLNVGNIQSHYYTYIYEVKMGESNEFPNQISNLNIEENETNITFTWDNDPTISKVYIYRDGTYVGTSTNSTFTDTPLLPKTTYNYEFVSVNSAGNVAVKKAQATTATPYVMFYGIGAAALDRNTSTSITLSSGNVLNITWDRDLTGHVVNFTWRNSSLNINPSLVIKDAEGNNLSFINAQTGATVTKMNTSTTTTTSSFIIPEGAHSIYINMGNSSYYTTVVYDIWVNIP